MPESCNICARDKLTSVSPNATNPKVTSTMSENPIETIRRLTICAELGIGEASLISNQTLKALLILEPQVQDLTVSNMGLEDAFLHLNQQNAHTTTGATNKQGEQA